MPPVIEHELRIVVALAILLEEVAPHVLGVGEHDGDELLEVVLARGLRVLDLRAGLRRAPGNRSYRAAIAADGYRGNSLVVRRGPAVRMTRGSTPKRNSSPSRIRSPTMPMPPPRRRHRRRSESGHRRHGKPKPPPSSRRSSTFSLCLSPRHRILPPRGLAFGTCRMGRGHCAWAALAHKVGRAFAGTQGRRASYAG